MTKGEKPSGKAHRALPVTWAAIQSGVLALSGIAALLKRQAEDLVA